MSAYDLALKEIEETTSLMQPSDSDEIPSRLARAQALALLAVVDELRVISARLDNISENVFAVATGAP